MFRYCLQSAVKGRSVSAQKRLLLPCSTSHTASLTAATPNSSNIHTVSCEKNIDSLITSFRSFSTHAAAALPPNLKFDPKSSFAPRPVYDDSNNEEVAEGDEIDDDDDFDILPETDAHAPVYAIPLPERLNVPIYTLFAPDHANQVGTIFLDEAVFGHDPIRVDFLKRAVDYYRAKKRGMRKAVSKTISERSGSGRKVRPQKGGGTARAGHSRPAHWRGGAKAHGPKNNTDYGNIKLNKKVRKKALQHALSQKLLEGNLILVNQLHELPTHKTGELARLLDPWDIAGRHGTTALILDHYYPGNDSDDDDDDDSNDEDSPKATSHRGVPVNLWVSSTNLFKLKVGNTHVASVYDILKYEKLIMTLSALEQIEERLKDV